VIQKVKNTIPVYDILAISQAHDQHDDVIAEPFAAYLKVHPNLHTPHRHSFYHIVLFTEGGGTHTIDFEQFNVQPRQIYFMIPGQVHNWNFDNEVNGYVINFSENLFTSFLLNQQYLEQFSFFRGIAQECVINLSETAFKEVQHCFKHIVNEVRDNKLSAIDIVRSYLLSLLITVSRENINNNQLQVPQQNQLILFNFRKLVDRYYAEKRLPKEYAAMLYITPNHLNALCNDLLGMAAGEVIRNRILLEAKRLLVNADQNISEIAYQLNFTDNSHFTKFFKKYTSLTPEEFRRSAINDQ